MITKRAISVTLNTDNVTWLQARVRSAKLRSVSELLDQLVDRARHAGEVRDVRSVAGTLEIDPADPLLEKADEAIRALFDVESTRGKRRRA
jgi:hypothetical protein